MSALPRNRRLLVPVAAGCGLGALVAFAAPRGPVTSVAAMVLLVISLACGTTAGWVAGSRWAMLLAPAGYALTFELLSDHAGLTTGAPSLSTWGIAGALAGRLLHGLVALLPLAVGAALGAGLARRPAPRPATRVRRAALGFRRVITGLLVAALGLLLWSLSRPASTPAESARPGAHPVAELTKVRLGGVDQWLSIRGQDDRAPVLLYLPGGPGQSDLGLGRALLEPLTHDFVVAILDGRGVGKSYPSFEASAMRTDRLVSDVVEAADYLRHRFRHRRIMLFGESAGSILGVLAVQQHPDRFAAWFGSGQMVDPLATDRAIRRDVERAMRADDDAAGLRHLRSIGQPPYAAPESYAWVAGKYETVSGSYAERPDYKQRVDAADVGPLGLGAPEYTLVDRFGAIRGLMDTFATVYPQWQTIDFRRSVRELRVPVHVFIGDHELAGRRAPADEWFRMLSAPWKQWHEIRDAGHAAAFEDIEEFRRALLAEAARTQPSGPPSARRPPQTTP